MRLRAEIQMHTDFRPVAVEALSQLEVELYYVLLISLLPYPQFKDYSSWNHVTSLDEATCTDFNVHSFRALPKMPPHEVEPLLCDHYYLLLPSPQLKNHLTSSNSSPVLIEVLLLARFQCTPSISASRRRWSAHMKFQMSSCYVTTTT